jgi:hypothetical protein
VPKRSFSRRSKVYKPSGIQEIWGRFCCQGNSMVRPISCCCRHNAPLVPSF